MNAISVNQDNPNVEGRSVEITLGGQQYELVLTTLATKQIARRFGGLENLGEKLSNTEHFEDALDEIVYLITLLTNQSVMIHNLWHPDDKRELLTEEAVELLSTPYDLAEYKNAIVAALYKGTKRYVQSEETDEKTRKQPGKRRRIVRPAAVLWCEPAAPSGTGSMAHAVRCAARSMGSVQAVQRPGKAARRRDH